MPKRVPKNKVRLEVLIDREVYELLIKMAPSIYGQGKYRGALSYIVEEALRYYLASRALTQTHTNPRASIRQVYEKVVDKLKEITHLPFKPKEIPEKILDLAIAEVRGSDPRTIAKWKTMFEKVGLIKFVGGLTPNRMVELL